MHEAEALPALRAIGDEAAATPRAPSKWSPREIVGHLIDSASNNHGRFVRLALGRPPELPGYAQDDWVAFQRYDARPWADLVALWAAYNLHLAHVMEQVTPGQRAHHGTVGGADVTLDFLLGDYVEHLRHHLGQVLEA